MFCSESKIRVRYAETDRMGYAYYGNYAVYFEVGRVEALRVIGITYKSLEDEGVLLPVVDFHIRYFLPAFYDDELTIRTTITQLPSVRISFEYETYRGEELLNKGKTDLVFVNKETGKPMKCPPDVLRAMEKFFRSER